MHLHVNPRIATTTHPTTFISTLRILGSSGILDGQFSNMGSRKTRLFTFYSLRSGGGHGDEKKSY
jgi:hypothetical protein